MFIKTFGHVLLVFLSAHFFQAIKNLRNHQTNLHLQSCSLIFGLIALDYGCFYIIQKISSNEFVSEAEVNGLLSDIDGVKSFTYLITQITI